MGALRTIEHTPIGHQGGAAKRHEVAVKYVTLYLAGVIKGQTEQLIPGIIATTKAHFGPLANPRNVCSG